eukprot:10141868-Lingulodinium_polyedra.AAC.1
MVFALAFLAFQRRLMATLEAVGALWTVESFGRTLFPYERPTGGVQVPCCACADDLAVPFVEHECKDIIATAQLT